VKRRGPILLASGLPLERKPSFFRQLRCLAAVWKEQGRRVDLYGPAFPAPRSEAEALIALGYPDQFPFFCEGLPGGPEKAMPCFLWSQFSRVSRRPLPGWPIYVPLTPKTESFLRRSGCSKMGPVIPHGVDTRLFMPAAKPRRSRPGRGPGAGDVFVIGTVGANSRRKRFDLIIRSFALFARRRPQSRLIIKTNRLASLDGVDLPELIAREKIGDRVEIILDELPDRLMAELYGRMDLYLNLSEWEGFCIPVIEAMACGVAVVSLPIQGPGEILPYEDTLVPDSLAREEQGTVLHEANPQAVLGVILAAAEDDELRARLGRWGRAEAESRYDIRRIAALWEAAVTEGRG
jgi:glycosyltransferase involved in cell wall biosynthesis